MTKADLRKIYKQKREQLNSAEKLRLDDLLLLQFQQLDFNGINNVLSYWPMNGTQEPNTHLFTGHLRHFVPGITIGYPIIDMQSQTFNAIEINETTAYQPNKWGIYEPKEGNTILASAIELILVPMLVCDQYGNRIGYGKGFYDKFISTCNPRVIKIGFSYFEPVLQIEDVDNWDMPLTHCVTPQQVYEF